ncbi:MAG: glycosyltransferase family 39 protein [Bacteroidota bacterium]
MPKVPFWIFILIGILYFTAARVDTMDIDASQYAEISRAMLQRGDYLHVYDRGFDYLDKPPMLFWVSALSMKVFGVNNFGFKLPSILFALWALFATYKLGKRLYDDTVGRMAALVLATCQGMFLMTNDIRCDTILMSWVVTAVWLIQEWVASRRLLYLLGGFAAVAFGMMTKGPIAMMVPVFCFATDWALKREWKNLFKPQYILGLVIVAVLLIPMSIGLYQQFDAHPEKVVNGNTNVSGLRFFYWSQSFGRITGESPWKNGAGIDFLLLNMLWSFLPWIVLFVVALLHNVVQLVRQRFRLVQGQEWVTTGGFLLSYLALGSSAYQLPHYIFIAFPFAAIITAKFIYDMAAKDLFPGYARFFTLFQPFIALILLIAVFVLISWFFPAGVLYMCVWVAGLIAWLYIAYRKNLRGKFFWLSAAAMIVANIFLNNHLYPTLLQYQAGSMSGRYMTEYKIPVQQVIRYKMDDPMNSVHFYAGAVIPSTDTIPDLRGKQYVLTMDKGIGDLAAAGVPFDTVRKSKLFKVSELTPEFINTRTRAQATRNYYLLRLRY